MSEYSSQSSLFEATEPETDWGKIVTPAAMEAVAQPRGELIAFRGERGLFALGHYLLAWRIVQEESVVLVDGANLIDLPLILRLTRGLQTDARTLLSRIHLSRAFTVHQLEAVIGDRLEAAMEKFQSRLCFVSGLLDPFHDEDVPQWEAARIFGRVLEKLRALADRGRRIVVLAPDPPVPAMKRENLAPMINKTANRSFTLAHEANRLVLLDQTRSAGDSKWVLPAIQLRRHRYSPR